MRVPYGSTTQEKYDNDSQAFITFWDANKYFYVVEHNSMLGHLYGKNGQLFEKPIFKYLIYTRVIWKNEISNSINEGQDLWQGGKSSANCFKAHNNKPLSKIEDYPSDPHY